MPKERRSSNDLTASEHSGPCHICVSKNHIWRLKHWSNYDGDLAQHLRESLPLLLDGKPDDARIAGILQSVHSMHARYGGQVDERGVPLSAWEARRAQHNQYEKTYTSTEEPRTPTGRKITFRAFLHLLSVARSPHAPVWLEMLTEQFTEASMADEGQWSDFVRFLHEFERSSQDPHNAEFVERVDVRPVVAMAGGKK